MSKIEELIQQYCPEGVEYVPLGDLGTIRRGNGLQKKDFVGSGVGCIHYGQIYTKFGTFTDKTLTFVDIELASHLLHIEKGDLVIACTSENVEDVCKAVVWLGDEKIVTGGHSCVFHHSQNPKYIAYFFQTEFFQQQKRKYAYGTKVIDIKPDNIGKIIIPLPPLPVQEEIVRILDTFTELQTTLQTELEAELQARQLQYQYYRDQLLAFDTGCTQMLELQQCVNSDCSMSYGIVQPGDDYSGGVPVVRPVDLSSYIIHSNGLKQVNPLLLKSYSRTELKGGELLVCVRGTTGVVSFAGEDLRGCNVTRGIVPLRFNSMVDSHYMYHLFNSDYVKKQIENKTQGAALQQINVGDLKKLSIPILPIQEQKRIATILDKFNSLVNDLSQGLPAEIEARKQQYEYYRDKLLTFKRKEA